MKKALGQQICAIQGLKCTNLLFKCLQPSYAAIKMIPQNSNILPNMKGARRLNSRHKGLCPETQLYGVQTLRFRAVSF